MTDTFKSSQPRHHCVDSYWNCGSSASFTQVFQGCGSCSCNVYGCKMQKQTCWGGPSIGRILVAFMFESIGCLVLHVDFLLSCNIVPVDAENCQLPFLGMAHDWTTLKYHLIVSFQRICSEHVGPPFTSIHHFSSISHQGVEESSKASHCATLSGSASPTLCQSRCATWGVRNAQNLRREGDGFLMEPAWGDEGDAKQRIHN